MIYILTPTVGWALPIVWPLLVSIAGGMGYKLYTSTADDAPLRGKLNKEMNNLRVTKLALEELVKDIVADEVGREQVLRFVKDDIVVIFKRDMRGKFSVEVMGPITYTTRQLESIGLQFAGTLVQQFAYNKVAQEMERRGANVVAEEETAEGDIVLKLRRWE